jgi:hypothetical protein
MKKKIEFDQECSTCNGTGLYVGMGERDGVAVVCHYCGGTGKYHYIHEYNEFKGRKVREDIDRVIEVNAGICVGKDKNGNSEWAGGMPYINWLNGDKFVRGMEMRGHTCPAWYYQSADYKRMPKWNECIGIGSFSGCKHFCNKDKCWTRFDEENK